MCGRTGAGKSSLITMLLRLVPTESGRVLIDGTDISKIGVKTLRSRLAIVPQDPIIYTGTLRYNLVSAQHFLQTRYAMPGLIQRGASRILLSSSQMSS